MKTRVLQTKPRKLKFLVLNFNNNVRYTLSPNMICYCVVIMLNLANIALCNINNGENTESYTNDSLLQARDLFEDSNGLVWSEFLEDYVLSLSASNRASKDLPFLSEMTMVNSNMQQPPINYHSSAYKRPGIYATKRIGEAVELEPHLRPPLKVVNPQFRPMTNQMLHLQQQQQQQPQQTQHQQQPSFLQQLFGVGGGGSNAPTVSPQVQQQQQMRPVPLQHAPIGGHSGPQNFRTVTENDLYLLGAIEKLVYRVDYLESRIRRSEQLIYYLMAGNNQKEVRDPCPTNFTRINDNCYHINSYQQVNWKTANSACKALNAHLAEFERGSENEEIMAYLLNQPNHRGHDYWLGALNPGLLWIWSNSAKPVNPNMNLTSIAMSQDHIPDNVTKTNDNESNAVNNEKSDEPDTSSNEILNNTLEIKGQGRCLRLTYNPTKHIYIYYGQECTSRHHYICEYEDKTLDNKIKKITRDLKLFD